jgi:hypothetical protein
MEKIIAKMEFWYVLCGTATGVAAVGSLAGGLAAAAPSRRPAVPK